MTEQQEIIFNFAKGIFKPRPYLTGSEWADEHFMLSAESSSLPGKWTTRPYQREILDCMCDTHNQMVVVKKPTRVGYNKLINITMAYFIEQQPAVILYYNPNESEAKGVAETEVEPMIRDNDLIAKLVETPSLRGRIKKEKTIKKNYTGVYLEILVAESDRNLNRRTARVVIGDEIDTWNREAGKAGDTITTMLRRSQDFALRKNILGGKPVGAAYEIDLQDSTIDYSKVDYWYKQGDMRQRWLPCPHCKELQLFEFEDMVWDKEIDDKGKTTKHLTETAHFVCKSCDERIFNKHKLWMDEHGKWIPQKPSNKIASFHFWAMLSYSPNVTWTDIANEFLNAKKDRLKLKAFYNEVLARTWEEDYETVNISNFEDRKEVYTAEVPDGVLILSAGVDTQDNRLECEVVGWGEAEESWSIDYKIFHGDTSKPEVWQRLDEYLNKTFTHDNGGLIKIYCAAVDTGGHRAKEAYAFCKTKFARRIFAIKGAGAIDAPIAPRLATRSNKGNVALYSVGVNMAADVIFSHLMTESHGAGYMHFPAEDVYDEEYFKQLTGEKRDKFGRWHKTRARNEALDVRVYAYASLFIAGVDLEVLTHRGPLLFTQKQADKPKRERKSYLDEY